MESLLAGFVAGYALGLLALVLLATSPRTLIDWSRRLQAQFPDNAALPAAFAGVALVAQTGWGVLGLVFGAVYWALRDTGGGLGSPSLAFTIAVLVLAAGGAVAAWVVQPAWTRRALVSAISFAAIIGWFLPHLAEA
ncbi:MAG: hypothetical protein OXG19_07740 [Chloroflexi bacterium]|nr:hypothetical protein [Chloroflexota bacterium]